MATTATASKSTITAVHNHICVSRSRKQQLNAIRCFSSSPMDSDFGTNNTTSSYFYKFVKADSISTDNNADTWKAMSMLERIKSFDTGMQEVWNDYHLFRNIVDASKTPLNAWTVDHPNVRRKQKKYHSTSNSTITAASGSGSVVLKQQKQQQHEQGVEQTKLLPTTTTTARIPRKQQEQMRRFIVDSTSVIPTLVLFCLPVVGYIPVVLAAVTPRQVLSRQFHNEYEIFHFSRVEFKQREEVFDDVAHMFWDLLVNGFSFKEVFVLSNNGYDYDNNNTMEQKVLKSKKLVNYYNQNKDNKDVNDKKGDIEDDPAGPLLFNDLTSVYLTFAKIIKINRNDFRGLMDSVVPTTNSCSSSSSSTSTTGIDIFSKSYMSKLALSLGYNQFLPSWSSYYLTVYVTPKRVLRNWLLRTAETIVNDDTNLLQENYHLNQCQSLTDEEVLDACLMRSLPIVVPSSEETYATKEEAKLGIQMMRKSLTNYLNIISHIRNDLKNIHDKNKNLDYSYDPIHDDTFKLFTLHLSIIRHNLRLEEKQKKEGEYRWKSL